MSRFLSELLGAKEVALRAGLMRLEKTSGHQSIDVRLTSEIMQATQAKLRDLGLDPHDTTGGELYAVLQMRLQHDERRLTAALLKRSTGKADEDLMAHIARVLDTLPISKQCFAMKLTVARKLLKQMPPKRTMKALGYRSVDSMIKHESPASLLAAGKLLEPATWHSAMIDKYKKLKPTDFEMRGIAMQSPASKRWEQLAVKVTSDKKHHLVTVTELGTVVLLPLAERPRGVVIATCALALNGMNEIRASSTFLKLCQVRPNFGAVVQAVSLDEPYLAARMLDEAVPWQLIQRYYARAAGAFRPEIFEPHIEAEDLGWHSLEKILAQLEFTLEFWDGTAHLALNDASQPVPLNLLDVALSYCNELPFEKRIVHHFRHSLWHELLLRYLKHDTVEQAVLAELQTEPALI